MNSYLSLKEKELVAVAASVAAGCAPCTQYHVKEVKAAGATPKEISAAIDAALCVHNSAREIIQQVAYTALGQPKIEQLSCCAGPSNRLKELASIAAAVAVNCPTNLRKHIEAGRALGVRDDEIQFVVGLAQTIQRKAREKIDEATKNLSSVRQPQEQACCGPTVTVEKERQSQLDASASGCCEPATSTRADTQPAHVTKSSCC